MELQALREEFNLRQSHQTENSPREAKDNKTSQNQMNNSQPMPHAKPPPAYGDTQTNKTLDSERPFTITEVDRCSSPKDVFEELK